MKYNTEIIGTIIEKERKKKNWERKDLANIFGITDKQIGCYENKKTLPPLDNLLRLCEIFDCELGYLLGEESYLDGTKLQTAICRDTGLSVESINALRGISTYSPIGPNGRSNEKYKRVLNNVLSSKEFASFISCLVDLDETMSEKQELKDNLNQCFEKDVLDEAISYHKSNVDYEHNSEIELSPTIVTAIKAIDEYIEDSCELSYAIKIARYEVFSAFEELINQLYPKNE